MTEARIKQSRQFGTQKQQIRGGEMSSEIMVAIMAFLGTLIGVLGGSKLTSYRIEQLEKKVDKHNNFAHRLPVVEEQIKMINQRLEG